MSEKWLSEYDRTSGKLEEVQAAINERARLAKSGSDTSKVTNQIRRLFQEINSSATALEMQLEDFSRQYLLPEKEIGRRQDLISTLKGRYDQMNALFKKSSAGYSVDDSRSALLSGPGAGGAGKPRFESEATRTMDNGALIQQQDQIMREQDQGLDSLSQSIARQKQLGLAIGQELDEHNEMLGDLNAGMDNTQRRLKRETKHVEYITEKTKTGGMICCIVLLIIAIIVCGAAL